MNKRIALPLVFTLILSAVATGFLAGAGEKVDLKLNLEAGKTYRTRMVNDQKMKTNMMGQEMNMNNQQTMDMAMAVQSVAGGLATVAISYERIAANVQGPQGTMSFDSAEPSESPGPQEKMYGAMVGSEFTVVTDEHGDVKEVYGVEEMLDKMFANMPAGNAQAMNAMKAQFSKMFGAEGSQSPIGQVFGMLPPGPVAVGESWTKSIEMEAMGKIKSETTYTLKSVSGGKAVVEAHADISSGADSEPMDMGMMKVKMEITGEQNGTIEIDLATGLVTGGSMVTTAKGMQKFIGGQGPMKDAEMPIDMTITSTWQPL